MNGHGHLKIYKQGPYRCKTNGRRQSKGTPGLDDFEFRIVLRATLQQSVNQRSCTEGDLRSAASKLLLLNFGGKDMDQEAAAKGFGPLAQGQC